MVGGMGDNRLSTVPDRIEDLRPKARKRFGRWLDELYIRYHLVKERTHVVMLAI